MVVVKMVVITDHEMQGKYNYRNSSNCSTGRGTSKLGLWPIT